MTNIRLETMTWTRSEPILFQASVLCKKSVFFKKKEKSVRLTRISWHKKKKSLDVLVSLIFNDKNINKTNKQWLMRSQLKQRYSKKIHKWERMKKKNLPESKLKSIKERKNLLNFKNYIPKKSKKLKKKKKIWRGINPSILSCSQ